MTTRIFISHRTQDERIASIFNRHFQRWNVRGSEIYQSSEPGSGPRMGEPLMPQLLQALKEAVLFLWIYTTPDDDEYCVMEATVAMNPAAGDTKTRVVVFQVAENRLRLFPDQVFFRNTSADVRKFVHQFHKECGFYHQDAPYQEEATEELIKERADDLCEDLAGLQLPGGHHQERWRWDRFTLLLNRQDVLQLDTTADVEARRELLRRGATVVDHFGSALVHFGYMPSASEITLSNLVERWRQVVKTEPFTREGWIDFVCDEMYGAIQNMPTRPRWELMKSSLYSNDWFYPVLNHARLMPHGGFEFDIYIYRLPGDLPYTAAVCP